MRKQSILTNRNYRLMILGVFLIFFLVMLWQHAYIYLYHDDFGYATLSYLADFNDEIQGNQFTLRQMLIFLREHYMIWGGRLVPLITLLSILRWNFWVFRITQPMVLTLILYFSMKLVQKTNHIEGTGVTVATILIGLYGLIQVQLHNNGTYWASASLFYVWPFLWIFGVGFLLNKYNTLHLHKAWLLLLLVLFFCCGLSQEQVFFVAIFMVLGFLITHIINFKSSFIKIDLLCLLMLLIGFSILFFSPGNFIRANNPIYSDFYALNFLQRIRSHLPSFLSIVFGKHNLWIYLLLLVSNVLSLQYLVRKEKINLAIFYLLVGFQLLFIFILSLLSFRGVLIGKIPSLDRLITWLEEVLYRSEMFWLTFLVFVSIPGFLYSYHNRSFILFGIYLGGVLSQFSMLLIPTVNLRFVLILLFSVFPLLTSMLVKFLEELKLPRVSVIIMGLLILSAIINTSTIIAGYQKNSPIHQENQQLLMSSQLEIEQGMDIRRIVLHKLRDDQYSGAMPYMKGYDYINYWIRKYYQIPMEIELYWEK